MWPPELETLLDEYDTALTHTAALFEDLDDDELYWRPNANSSAIGWHLGHQALVAHFMIRNLTAAEPSPDPGLEAVMDSATPETARGDLPDRARLVAYRSAVAERVRHTTRRIDAGEIGVGDQLRIIATGLLVAVIDHEYQHSVWIAEVRGRDLARSVPSPPGSPLLTMVDGYTVVSAPGVVG